tara:strand:+ start:1133 stop:1567 length:435 start_codon:yes stop_codon:yes gene_type:complete
MSHKGHKGERGEEGIRVGFVASCFDLLHAGHCLMLKDAKDQCDHLMVALQTDPTIDRPDSKSKPILSMKERRILLESNRYVDEIVEYSTEKELEDILEKTLPYVRILGSDYRGRTATGTAYSRKIYYHERDHDYSSTNIRKRLL